MQIQNYVSFKRTVYPSDFEHKRFPHLLLYKGVSYMWEPTVPSQKTFSNRQGINKG